MVDIEDKSRRPELEELLDYVELPLFRELFSRMETDYQAQCKVEYSGDQLLLGWNVKFKKAGRTLCTIYPRRKHFFLLLITGRREKERVEKLLLACSDAFKDAYQNTVEGMGQRWLIFDFNEHTDAFDDVLQVVRIRREKG